MKWIIGITGASGSIYAKLLLTELQKIKSQWSQIDLVFSENSKKVWRYELGDEDYSKYPFKIYASDDFFAPTASGSAEYNGMIIIPCSMGTLGRIASGTSDNLLIRSADVMLKERKKLILVTREAPLNLIHINNMKTITEAGGIICPASPSFYFRPENISELLLTVINRVLLLSGFNISSEKWGN